jgi:hypothetical protein
MREPSGTKCSRNWGRPEKNLKIVFIGGENLGEQKASKQRLAAHSGFT